MVSQFVGRVVLLLGGGAAGAALFESKGSMGDITRGLSKILAVGGSGSDSSLNSKVESLSQEMRAILARGGNGASTIVVQAGSSSGSLITRLLFLAVPGAGIWVYMRFKGYALADIKWVSAHRFQEAVASIGKAQEVLEGKLSSFRASAEQALTTFQAMVERQFSEQSGQMEQIEHSVGAAHAEVQGVRGELAGVDSRVQRLEGKIDDASRDINICKNQLEYSSQGIHLLCNIVSESMGSSNSASAKRLQTFAASSAPRLANASELDAAPIMIEYEKPGREESFTKSLPNPVMTLGILGGSFAAGSRNSANLSATYPPRKETKESDNPPEPSSS